MFQKVLILMVLVSLAGCAGKATPATPVASVTQSPVASNPAAPKPSGLEKIRLPMGYIPNVQYAPFYVAVEKGFFRDAGFEIAFDYKFETDGVALVGANQLPFALVSGEQVLLARAQAIPVVYFFAWWQNYPVAIASVKEANIHAPADLKGKKIGLPGLFGASYIGLRALLAAGGLSEADVTLDSIGFNQVEAIAAGQEQAVVIYANNEPFQLTARGYPVDVLKVADYLQLASNGIITNETILVENPELVRRMAQAVGRGIQYVLTNPDESFEICKKYVEGLEQLDQNVQRQVLTESIKFWRAPKIGVSNPEAWGNMQKVLLDMKLLSVEQDITKAYTNDFVK